MDTGLQLVVSAALGAVAGASASLAVAARLARGSELGRVQEEARQSLLSVVRLYRARVDMDRADNTYRSAMNQDYLTQERSREFVESVEQLLVHQPRRFTKRVREHLVRLVGPVAAETARIAAPLPAADRTGQWEALLFFDAAKTVGEGKVEDNGLIGGARDGHYTVESITPVVTELRSLEATVSRGRVGLFRS